MAGDDETRRWPDDPEGAAPHESEAGPGTDPVLAEAGCRPIGLLAASRHARVHAVAHGGRPAVLKRASLETMADPVGRARFAREGRVGLGLHHPGLVETVAAGADWILLGDLRGPSGAPCRCLADRVRDAGRSFEAVTSLLAALAPVAAGLAHMHARGLVHRDVKPGNILITPDGRSVLIDLGAVGLSGGDPLGAEELVGAPAWMAPEQRAGAPPAPEADAWSFAAVLGFVLSGAPPYAGTADAVLERRRAGEGPEPAFRHGSHPLARTELGRLVAAGMEGAAGRPTLAAFAAALAAGPGAWVPVWDTGAEPGIDGAAASPGR